MRELGPQGKDWLLTLRQRRAVGGGSVPTWSCPGLTGGPHLSWQTKLPAGGGHGAESWSGILPAFFNGLTHGIWNFLGQS